MFRIRTPILVLLSLLLVLPLASASVWDYLTIGRGDVRYCKQNGFCILDNLTVNNYVNFTVTNYNVTGGMTVDNLTGEYITATYYCDSTSCYSLSNDLLNNASFNSSYVAGLYVPYTGATSNVNLGGNDLTVNGNTFYINSTCNRIGIGTTAPSAPLSVTGGVTISDYLHTKGGAVFNDDGLTLDFRVESDDETNMFIVDGGNNAVGIRTHTPASTLDVDGNLTVSERIGVGTATPTYALDVVGDIGLDNRIYHNNDVNSYIYMLPDRILSYVGAEALLDLYEGTQDYVKLGDGGDVDINLNNNVYIQGFNSMVGVATSSPTSYLHTGKSFATGVICTNKDMTLTASHCVVLVDASREAITITLPSVSEINGRWYMIKKIDASVNPVIIDGDGAETIDGALTYDLGRQWSAKTIVSYFSMAICGWYINDR